MTNKELNKQLNKYGWFSNATEEGISNLERTAAEEFANMWVGEIKEYDNQETKDLFDGYVSLIASKELKNLRLIVKDRIHKEQEKAMKTNGYIVIVKDGWVVKQWKNGEIEKIFKL